MSLCLKLKAAVLMPCCAVHASKAAIHMVAKIRQLTNAESIVFVLVHKPVPLFLCISAGVSAFFSNYAGADSED